MVKEIKFNTCLYYDKNKKGCVHKGNNLKQKKYPKCPYLKRHQIRCKLFL